MILILKLGILFFVNDKVITENAKNTAIKFLGKENVVDLNLRMTSEDFALLVKKVHLAFIDLVLEMEKLLKDYIHLPLT